jgi:tetratricopeptide (TPR) repeat protein
LQDPIRALVVAALAAEQGQDWNLASSLYQALRDCCGADHRVTANLASVCWYADRPLQARKWYAESAALAPEDPLPWRGLGNALRDCNRFEVADRAYGRSLALGDLPLTRWNHSQLLQGLERYPEAYGLAEARFDHPGFEGYRPSHGRGGPSIGPTPPPRLAIWSEQGFGDTLQYLRWCVPLQAQESLMAHASGVVLEVEPCLERLVRLGLGWLASPPSVRSKTTTPEPLAQQALHCSLLSLPHHLGGAPLAGVFEPTQRFGHWDGYLRSSVWPLAGSHHRPRIGLVWAAGRKLDDPFTAREYRKRSLPPEALAALIEGLHGQGAELSHLQIGPDRDQAKPWADLFVDALPAQADFADTAAWIRQLDLLISADTASAHLAGALGHPCWMLLPYSADPRWLRDRSDSPWYPSLRLFRQPQTGQWQPVIEQVLSAFRPWWQQASG